MTRTVFLVYEAHIYSFIEKEGSLSAIFDYDLNPNRILNELNFRLNHVIDFKKDLVIFDEIQACPRALSSLKYFNEDIPELAVCSAGSHLGIHLSEAPFPVGKVDMLSMQPIDGVILSAKNFSYDPGRKVIYMPLYLTSHLG